MKLISKGWISLLVSTATFFSSFFINIIPCQIKSNIPNSLAKWGLCSLNPDETSFFVTQKTYFGLTNSIANANIITIIFVFILTFGVLSLLFKKKKQDSKED